MRAFYFYWHWSPSELRDDEDSNPEEMLSLLREQFRDRPGKWLRQRGHRFEAYVHKLFSKDGSIVMWVFVDDDPPPL